ncbi:rCG37804 [Rattus norvegicus]|uniref:RCG37804 n=1 Tax=Rattus norvegicus TaxID=10116 RepID=A6KQP9_RAT|nr:rCG37804 [Rattus norvegicus]
MACRLRTIDMEKKRGEHLLAHLSECCTSLDDKDHIVSVNSGIP